MFSASRVAVTHQLGQIQAEQHIQPVEAEPGHQGKEKGQDTRQYFKNENAG